MQNSVPLIGLSRRSVFSGLAGIAIASVIALATPTHGAVIITTADGGGADTHVSNDGNQAATTNHGSKLGNDLRRYDGVRAKVVYLKFDISAITGDLSGATLTINLTSNRTRTMNVYGLADGAGDLWGESTITYDSAPGILQPADGGAAYNSGNATFNSDLSLLGTFTTASGLITTSTASMNMDAFLNADTNGLVTLVFFTASSDSAQSFFVSSKESGADTSIYPTLTLPNASVPEPGAMALAAVGGLVLMLRRGRVVRA